MADKQVGPGGKPMDQGKMPDKGGKK